MEKLDRADASRQRRKVFASQPVLPGLTSRCRPRVRRKGSDSLNVQTGRPLKKNRMVREPVATTDAARSVVLADQNVALRE